MNIEEPGFHLEAVVREKDNLSDFEGPLSLILLLLQKNKIEIRDIRISDILDQYLEYLDKMQKLDLEIASEFVRMASYLLYIKTKTLLNSDEEISELELLMESLEQLKNRDTLTAINRVTPILAEAYKTGALYISKPPEPASEDAGEYKYHHTSVELLAALYTALSSNNEKIVDVDTIRKAIPNKITYSVKTKSRQILSKLKLRNMSISDLYSECSSSSEIVATFISVLELCSMGSVVISVSKSGNDYEISFAGGDVDEIIGKIEE